MKKTISIMLCLLLIFSSVNSVFASATSWDTTDQANLQSIKSALTSSGTNTLYSIISRLSGYCVSQNKGVAAWADDIENHLASTLYLTDGGSSRSITWWIKEAVLDLDSIKDALIGVSSGSIGYYLQNILGMLSYSDNGTLKSWLADMWQVNSVNLPLLNSLYNLDNKNGTAVVGGSTNVITYNWPSANGGFSTLNVNYSGRNWRDTLISVMLYLHNNMVNEYVYTYRYMANGYNNSQNAVNWGNLGTSTFTPSSFADGTFKWLSAIQAPIARLSYVHASDEEIEAREKAATNQNAVVDNFIDSNGSGATTASSFGDVASMSAGYSSNMNTDASASGIWNIFNSNNFGWFSQETANQLDTTTVSTRKGSSDFDTPLLDQQISDIYKELGVDVND